SGQDTASGYCHPCTQSSRSFNIAARRLRSTRLPTAARWVRKVADVPSTEVFDGFAIVRYAREIGEAWTDMYPQRSPDPARTPPAMTGSRPGITRRARRRPLYFDSS